MLDRSSAPASHREHAINLINQLMSKNVIGFMDIHRYVSMSVNATRSKNVEHMNKIDSNILYYGVFF